MRLTASKVGLAKACGYWLTPSVELPVVSSASAIEGTRVHTLIEHDDGKPTEERAVLTARKYIATIGNRPMSKEPALGWDGKRVTFLGTGRETYADRTNLVAAGTVDLLTNLAPRRWRVTDWKNGEHGTHGAEDQLRTLAALLLTEGPERVDAVEMHAVWLQGDGEAVDYGTMLDYEAPAVLAELRSLGPTEPRPGDHCSELYCPLVGKCPAFVEAAGLVPVASLVRGKNPLVVPIADIETARNAVELLGMVEDVVKSKKAELRAYVEQHHDAKLPLEDGRIYGPIPCKGRSGVDGDAAVDLAAKLGASKEDLARLVKTGAPYDQWRVHGKKKAS